MSVPNNIPDFFIVGAPKCGTTALDYHLNEHPEIFMAKKEIHYFGSDLGMIQEPLNENKYLSHFETTNTYPLKGESSVWYLYSKNAAKEIKAFNPNAKIIILLRNPSQMIPSLHGQHLFNAIETELDLKQAFKLDMERLRNNVPYPCSHFEQRPYYLSSVLYYKQVKRFIDEFKDNVLVLLHKDLKNDFEKTYKETITFLGVNNTTFCPDNKSINARKEIKSQSVHELSKNPPRRLKNIFRTLVPFKPIRHSIMKNVERINVSTGESTNIDPALKQEIIDLTEADIIQLQSLIKRDLSAWLD